MYSCRVQPGMPQQQRLYEDFARLPRGGLIPASPGSGTGIPPPRPPYASGMAPPSMQHLSQVCIYFSIKVILTKPPNIHSLKEYSVMAYISLVRTSVHVRQVSLPVSYLSVIAREWRWPLPCREYVYLFAMCAVTGLRAQSLCVGPSPQMGSSSDI